MTSNCEHGCDGSGWIAVTRDEETRPGAFVPVTRMARCECLKAKIRRERIEQLSSLASIPDALRTKTFDSFDRSIAPAQWDAVRGWADRYTSGCHSLLLYGACKGVGKTHLAAAAANVLLDQDEVLFVTAPDLMGRLQEKEDPGRLLEAMCRVRLLVLDDLGQADDGDPKWLRAKKHQAYFRMLNHREQNGLTLVATSNLESMEDFAGAVGEAAMDRLIGMCGKSGLVKFTGLSSYRLRALL